ncbi:MAG: thiamine phosphate synthase [Leptonema sp. (in: Bacteria)]|nr:thiamine phosphate synthase [Leptonema sp. (in: bacteria)]
MAEPIIIKPYPILDESLLSDLGLVPSDLLDLWADEGISFFQYRVKKPKGASRVDRIDEIDHLARRRNLRWLLNDFDELFTKGTADGLHLGWEDWQKLKEQRRAGIQERMVDVGPIDSSGSVLSGISTHNIDQWSQAVELHRSGILPLSYIAIGPCFKTKTKRDGLYPQLSNELITNLEKLRQNELKVGNVPDSVYIGGINPDTLPNLVKAIESGRTQKKEPRVIYIASIRALSDPLDIRRFRSIPNWQPS